MAQIVTTNAWLLARITEAQTAFNAGLYLRLFQNSFTPDPSNTLPGAFTECNFDTYAAVSLVGQFGIPFHVIDGEYESDSGTYTYASPATTPNTIYGWYITDGGPGTVYLAYLFPAAINFAVGAPSLQLQVLYREWSRSILP